MLLHDFFASAVRRWPERIAIEIPPGPERSERRCVSYAELGCRADGVAGWLGDRVADDDVVAVLLGRNSELLYVAQLGVLRAGGAYVCLDPSLPDARIQQILNDAAPVAVLTDASGAARLNQAIGRSCFSSAAIPSSGIAPLTGVLLHQELSASGDAARHFPGSTCERLGPEPASRQAQLPGSLAYIIYTSGTSGVPKGVMIEHRSIVNLIQSDLDEFQLTPDDRVAQISSPAYDSSVEETWLAFSAGATLVVVDEETVRLGPDLVPWLRQERITVFSPTPTLLRSMDCGNPAEELPELSLVYVGGEALPQDIAARWAPGRRLVNGYGPTECAVTAVRGRIEPASEGEVRIHIGKPVPGLSAWILDDELHEVPPGEPGELCLGGVALGRGYRNDPEQTARRFVNHPFLGRIYRTGDRAWREPDGNFGCGGRLDAQVKLRGHRFELEEVETCLAECPGVRAAGCRLHDDGAGRQTLAAFVVPADPASPPDLATLRSLVSARLPAPMVPSRFALLAHLPTTIGGKLDRKQLPDTPTPTEPPRSASAPPYPSHARQQVDPAPAKPHASAGIPQHPSHARQQVDPTPAAPPASASGAPHPVLEPTHDIHQPVAEGTRERTLIIVAAIQDCLLLPTAPDPEEDFFHDLGGDSLRAALLISALRRDPSTSHLTVRDVYKARTAAALAGCRPEVVRRAPPNGAHTHQTSAAPGSGSVERGAERSASRSRTAASGPAQAIAEPSHATTLPEHGGSRASLPEVRAAPRAMRSPLPASLVQGLWLMGSLLLGGWGAGVVASLGVPQAHAVVGLLPLMAVAMVLGPLAGLAWAVLTAAPAIAIKWLLIGRYRPLRAPAWGNFYVRNWIVQQAVSQIPWRLLAGTAVQVWVLRALGARIGRRVHVERGVDLTRGGWDLLEIGDDVTLSRDAAVGLVELHRGDIVVAPVVLGNGATLDVRAGVAGDTCVEGGGYLSPLSHLPAGGRIPAGQRWDGVPAAPAGPAPLRPVPDPTSRGLPDTVWGGLFLGAHTLTRFLLSLPQSAVAFGLAAAAGWDGVRLVELLRADGPAFWVGVAGVVGALPLSLGFEALLMRGLGPVSPGVVPLESGVRTCQAQDGAAGRCRGVAQRKPFLAGMASRGGDAGGARL